jgi:hypothetical protein
MGTMDAATPAEGLALDFDGWADLSARLLRLDREARADLLDERDLPVEEWDRVDEHWSGVLADEVIAGDMERAREYGRRCAEELARRTAAATTAGGPPPAPPAAPDPAPPLEGARTSPDAAPPIERAGDAPAAKADPAFVSAPEDPGDMTWEVPPGATGKAALPFSAAASPTPSPFAVVSRRPGGQPRRDAKKLPATTVLPVFVEPPKGSAAPDIDATAEMRRIPPEEEVLPFSAPSPPPEERRLARFDTQTGLPLPAPVWIDLAPPGKRRPQ